MFFKSHGILGQNARNLLYIKPNKNSFAKLIADSKLRTKQFLLNKGVSVPETYFVISNMKELDALDFDKLIPPFVVKPNTGFGGKGIIVIDEKLSSGNFRSVSGKEYSQKDLRVHFTETLEGFYSLSGNRDKVIIEQKIINDNSIDLLSKYGLPDIRIVLYNMVPIMAMMRIPTEKSGGKANVHAGACGVGIDIGTGELTYITLYGKYVKSIPGIGDVRGIKLPHWDEVLELGVKLQKITNIGYLACDIVLDDKKGPLLLEVNIRPGLHLQIASKAPLLARLKKVEGINVSSIEKGVRLGKDLFGGELKGKIKDITGNKLVGHREYLKIKIEDKIFKYVGNIHVENVSSYIDLSFVRDVLKLSEEEIEKGSIKLSYDMLGEKRDAKFIIKELDGLNIILGKSALRGFYIDPFKYKKGELPEGDSLSDLELGKNKLVLKNYMEQIKRIDKEIFAIDKKLLILKHITPINLVEEKLKFKLSEGEHIPEFKYNELDIDLNSLEGEVKKIDIGDIPLSILYKRKRDEILNKIEFLRAFSRGDSKEMTKFSSLLYGGINPENLDYSKEALKGLDKIVEENEFVDFSEIKSYIKKFNHIYSINVKLEEADIVSRFVMSGDKLKFRRGASVGKKEIRSIIAHEVEGHYLKRINGRKIPLKIFSSGTANYIQDEEGVAIYNQSRFLTEQSRKYYSIFETYKMIDDALSMSYKDLLASLREKYSNDYEKIFTKLSRLKRGFGSFDDEGAFMKDVVYVNGYLNVNRFIEGGGDLKDLYIGKVGIADLKDISDGDFLINKPKDSKFPLFL